MKTLNIQAAKTHLSRLVEEAIAGDDIIIAKAGKPMVKLVPVMPNHQPRKLGSLRGKLWMSSDCWEPDPHFGKVGRKPEMQTQQRFNNRSADILVIIGLFALQQADKNVGAPEGALVLSCLF
jgi:prevent-host-death family protein